MCADIDSDPKRARNSSKQLFSRRENSDLLSIKLIYHQALLLAVANNFFFFFFFLLQRKTSRRSLANWELSVPSAKGQFSLHTKALGLHGWRGAAAPSGSHGAEPLRGDLGLLNEAHVQ